MWQCGICLRTTKSPNEFRRKCSELPPKWKAAIGDPLGHHLCAANFVKSDLGSFVYCTRCAHYGTPRTIRLLASPCRGSPEGPGGIRDASSFSQGRHPRYGEFCRPWPLEPYCFIAAETVADPGGVVPEVRGRALLFDEDSDGDIDEKLTLYRGLGLPEKAIQVYREYLDS